jgi:Cu2+-exporting ATPase
MWPFSKTKPSGETAVFAIDGLHCSSCVLNIDGALEDLRGVRSSRTSYAKARTQVQYDPAAVSVEELRKTIESLGYQARTI